MTTETFVARARLPASAEEAYDWHARPGAFERLTPPWQRVEVIERSAGGIEKGTRLVLRVAAGPLRRRLRSARDPRATLLRGRRSALLSNLLLPDAYVDCIPALIRRGLAEARRFRPHQQTTDRRDGSSVPGATPGFAGRLLAGERGRFGGPLLRRAEIAGGLPSHVVGVWRRPPSRRRTTPCP